MPRGTHCGAPLQTKGQHPRPCRTLCGTVTLPSPRLYHCRWQRRKTTTCRPLTMLLPEPTAPARLGMETPWASLLSSGLTTPALQDVLPGEATLHATTLQPHTLAGARRGEDELGEAQWACVEGCPATWETLPIPDGPRTVGMDGGEVRTWEATKQQVDVLVGKRLRACRREDAEDIPSSQCLGGGQSLATKPQRRLGEGLQSQGHQMKHQRPFLSAGGDTVRDLQLSLPPPAEHLLAWVPLAMRLTVLQQPATGLPQTIQDEEETAPLRAPVVQQLARLPWALGPGNVYKAFPNKIAALAMELDGAVAITGDATARKLLKAIEECHTYSERTRAVIPNYGERYRYGARSRPGFVQSTVNQVLSRRFCKKPQMQWTKRGAHLLLPPRVKTLQQERAAVFQRWSPDLKREEDPRAA